MPLRQKKNRPSKWPQKPVVEFLKTKIEKDMD